ncbi:MAG: class I SAM-dependent methyltransferase [Gemmataceae bacterium]
MPYADLAFFHTHPRHLATVAMLCGLPATPVEHCRVLELGCGSGFNLMAMSQSLPHSQFVGVDLSQRQIEHGRAIAREIDCDRVDLRVGRIEDLDPSLGQFDYVIAHGVYSWLPPAIQPQLFEAMRRHLAPHGIGYVSYNTYPGWQFRSMLRNILCFFSPPDAAPTDRVRVTLEQVSQMLADLPEQDSLSTKVLIQEFEQIKTQRDYYLLHEHFTEFNTPVLVSEFVRAARQHGLNYLCESRYGTNTFAGSREEREVLDLSGDDLIRREQYHDFRWHRYFRQTLLVHDSVEPSRKADSATVANMYLHPRVTFDSPPGKITESEFDLVRREEDGEILELGDAVFRAILRRLDQHSPRALKANEFLFDIAEGFPEAVRMGIANAMLSAAVLRGYVEGYWHLYATEPPYAIQIREKPRACALARYQSQHTASITNRLHRTARLEEKERQLLGRLDGQLDRDELARQMKCSREEIDSTLERLVRHAVLDGEELFL